MFIYNVGSKHWTTLLWFTFESRNLHSYPPNKPYCISSCSFCNMFICNFQIKVLMFLANNCSHERAIWTDHSKQKCAGKMCYIAVVFWSLILILGQRLDFSIRPVLKVCNQNGCGFSLLFAWLFSKYFIYLLSGELLGGNY